MPKIEHEIGSPSGIPDPGEQFIPRYLLSELSAVVDFPTPGEQFVPRQLRSELFPSARIWEPVSTLGVWEPTNLLPDTITVSLSHA